MKYGILENYEEDNYNCVLDPIADNGNIEANVTRIRDEIKTFIA